VNDTPKRVPESLAFSVHTSLFLEHRTPDARLQTSNTGRRTPDS
jgi:hypothetical protein